MPSLFYKVKISSHLVTSFLQTVIEMLNDQRHVLIDKKFTVLEYWEIFGCC